jgi:pSer/pThr/pTyr-binding forkhead associated (FHA) protein
MFAFQSNQSCKINCVTWAKDAHALFDYESEEITKNIYTLGKGGKIFLDGEKGTTKYEPDNQEEGFFLTSGHTSSSEGCLLNFFNEYGSHTVVTKKIKDEYEYNKQNITEVQSMLYYVVAQKELKGIKREYKSEYHYKPEINDIIRFGRVQFIVRSMKDKSTENNNDESHNNKSIFLPNDNSNLKKNSNNKNLICEFCEKKDTDNINNPIVKVCPCKKCPLLHLNCFKNDYIKKDKMFYYSNKDYNSGTLKIVSLINFLCPYCNEPYNPIIKINSKFYNTLPYSFDKKAYHIILESINFVKDGVYCIMIIIFTFPTKKEEFFLGRGHEASFKISDISISRVHAKIYLKEDNVVIDDLGSKFGTLLLVRNSIDVNEMIEKKMKIQIGRNVVWLDKDDKDTEDNTNKNQ